MKKILVVNPGSTSTKVALYESGKAGNVKEIASRSITHSRAELDNFETTAAQEAYRADTVAQFLKENNVNELHCCAGRGAPVKALDAGSYGINDIMLNDLRTEKYSNHPSNLGALIAHSVAEQFNCPSLICDPVSVDQFEPYARYSGLPGINRRSRLHALNIRAMARHYGESIGKPLDELNLVVAHLGGGISIVPMKKGRMIDTNDANDGGPFSPQRAGTLPSTLLVKLCFSGEYGSAAELNNVLTKNAGLLAYLGTDDGREIEKRISEGDAEAEEIYHAMTYQIGREIGSAAAALKGEVDAVILTGGLSYAPLCTKWITEYVDWIAPVVVKAGEHELTALAEAGSRYIFGTEELKEY
ncbi:butyrate kinase [Spirochaeta isovalerica]|uniref:Probable butyrate kinase n=1 Tax=Spirochaeta isovalerica TaxID=150 RepID=A0A841R4X0_9SPIO|nr:butyrate kinase [Spirochaeta isovalerica]